MLDSAILVALREELVKLDVPVGYVAITHSFVVHPPRIG